MFCILLVRHIQRLQRPKRHPPSHRCLRKVRSSTSSDHGSLSTDVRFCTWGIVYHDDDDYLKAVVVAVAVVAVAVVAAVEKAAVVNNHHTRAIVYILCIIENIYIYIYMYIHMSYVS